MSKNMKLNTGDKVIYWPLGRGKPGYCATAVVGGFEGDFCILYPRVDLPGGGRSPVLGMRYSLTEGAIADGSTVALWDGTEEHFMTLRERARKDAGTAGQTGPTNHSGLPGVAGLSGDATPAEVEAWKRKYCPQTDAVAPSDYVVVPGVGPDSPTVTNAAGGRQSKVAYRLDLIPPGVLLAVGRVLAEGYEKYGPPTDGVENWRKIPAGDHLNRAMVHVAAYNAGDRSDDHLTHALCRLFFAAAMDGTRVTETTA